MERSELLKLFFQSLRRGLWNRAEKVSDLPLSASDWKQLFELAHRQAVTGLWIDGVSEGNARPDDALWGKWIGHLFHMEKVNAFISRRGEQWVKELAEAGISASVFKGSSVAVWYPRPLHRSYGDIDIVVTGGWEKLKGFLEAQNTELFRCESDEIVIQDPQGVYIEFHRQWEYLYHPKSNARLQELCKDGLSDEMYLVCLILHLQRHFLTYGIGLKQVCDVAVMLDSAQLNFREIADILKSLHAERFSRLLFGFIYVNLHSFVDFPLPPITKGNDYELLQKVILQEGYDLKMEQERVAGSQSRNLIRILDNAWFWTKRCFRLYCILPKEAFGFLVYKVSRRIKCVLPGSFASLWMTKKEISG